jgi:DNA repair protein RecO (recombination protein O)
MQLKSRGIVLHNFKYNDKKHIVKIFTQEKGLLTFMVTISASQKSKFKPAFFLPLTLLEIDYTFKEHKQFLSFTEVKCYHPYKSIHANFLKTSVALFANELLLRCLAAEDTNFELYDFIENFALYLDESGEAVTHLPNWFALHLTKYLGFFPLISDSEHTFFDMIEGVFRANAPSHIHFVNGDILIIITALIQANLSTIHSFQIPKVYRLEIQKIILEYYQLHHFSIKNLQSVEILKKVLSD